MPCSNCGAACHGKLCSDCLRELNQEETKQAGAYRVSWYVCPECGGDTSGLDVVCFRCRRVEA